MQQIWLVISPTGPGVLGIFLTEEQARDWRDTYFPDCRIYTQREGMYLPNAQNLATNIID